MSQIINISADITLYVAPISGAGNRRERERATAAMLMTEAAGVPCEILHRADGSPYPACGGMEISVSHSALIAGLAVSRRGRVGIDIEEWRVEQLRRVARRVLSEAEVGVYSDDAALLRAWTLKEAAYKAINGAPADLREIRLPLTLDDRYINTDTARAAIVWSGAVSVNGIEAYMSVVGQVD